MQQIWPALAMLQILILDMIFLFKKKPFTFYMIRNFRGPQNCLLAKQLEGPFTIFCMIPPCAILIYLVKSGLFFKQGPNQVII